jgi:hypothetical protein
MSWPKLRYYPNTCLEEKTGKLAASKPRYEPRISCSTEQECCRLNLKFRKDPFSGYLQLFLSTSLLFLPRWSIGHPLNVIFHFSFLMLRQLARLIRLDQPITRPLCTQTQTYIHGLSGIRTYDPSVWNGEDSSCLRPRGYCDRLSSINV